MVSKQGGQNETVEELKLEGFNASVGWFNKFRACSPPLVTLAAVSAEECSVGADIVDGSLRKISNLFEHHAP